MDYKLVDFEDFDLIHENENIEYKESFDKLPSDIWPTYSAFANTKGGLIILGVSEDNGNYEEVGVNNAPKIIQDFWNTINKCNAIIIKNVQRIRQFSSRYHKNI